MKLKPKLLRYMTTEEFRVLTAVEVGSKNHDIVPLELISSIAGLRHGGVHKFVANLLRNKLVAHDRKHYDGYRLTYSGYDYLALRTFVKRGTIVGIGRQVGVGKESDIHVAETANGETVIIKLHRLGRVSFRAIKEKRDYHQGRASASWLYLSRLAAIKEFAFMKALYEHKFPVPTPIDQNRHCCIMSLASGYPLVQVRRLIEPKDVYRTCMGLIVRLAKHGLIHGDFNEFNLMLNDKRVITLIDFPQMISVGHRNSEEFFDRDVEGVRRYFQRQYHYVDEKPVPKLHEVVMLTNLDAEVRASGFDEDKRHNLLDVLEDQRRLRGEVQIEEELGDSDSEWDGQAPQEDGNEKFEPISIPRDDDVADSAEAAYSMGRKIKNTKLSYNQRKEIAGTDSEDDETAETAHVEAAEPNEVSGPLRGVVRHRRGPTRRNKKLERAVANARTDDFNDDHGEIEYGQSDESDNGSEGDDFVSVSLSDIRRAQTDERNTVLVSTPFGVAALQSVGEDETATLEVQCSNTIDNVVIYMPNYNNRVGPVGSDAEVALLSEKEKRIFFACRAQGREYVHRRQEKGASSSKTNARKGKKKKKKLSAEQQAEQKRTQLERSIKMRVRRQRAAKAERAKKVNRNQNKNRERRKHREAVRDAM